MSLGNKIREVRKSQNLNQNDIASKCHLDVRTNQRIESGKVVPRLYTLRIINQVLGTDFTIQSSKNISEELTHLQKIFSRRRRFRIAMLVIVLAFIIFVGLIDLNDWTTFGMTEKSWTPVIYILLFIVLGAFTLIWRCPGCNAFLSDLINSKYCAKCGLQLGKEKSTSEIKSKE